MEKRTYRKYENDTITEAPASDLDGAITGKSVLCLSAWFDENPDKAKELGWIKFISTRDEVECDSQTQYVRVSYEKVDDYTYKEVYDVLDKTETMMLMEDLNSNQYGTWKIGGITISG